MSEKGKNTGLALSEVKGLFATLNNNLSGEHGKYWLDALKKLLRKEELPTPPPEVIQEIKKLDSHRINMREKVKALATYIEKIPVVKEICIVSEDSDDTDLLNIYVYASTGNFLHTNKDCDTAEFYLQTDGLVTVVKKGFDDERDTDSIYEKWVEQFKVYDSMKLKDLCVALIELGKTYEKTVLDITT